MNTPFRAPLPPSQDGPELQPVTIDLGHWSSTMAMHEQGNNQTPVLDRAQHSLARLRFAELLAAPEIQEYEAELLRLVNPRLDEARVSNPVLPEFDTLKQLADYLRKGEPEPGRAQSSAAIKKYSKEDETLRQVVELALEEVARYDPERFAPLLHRIYRDVSAVVPLRSLNLWMVALDGERLPEIPSVLNADFGRLEESRLMPDPAAETSGVVVHGLKSLLNAPREVAELATADWPENVPTTTDTLVGLAYLDLARRFEDGLELLGKGSPDDGLAGLLSSAKSRRVNQVNLTFPVTATPDVRRRQKQIVSTALGVLPRNVMMKYDEAAAAALYFLMHEFGVLAGGVTGFRSRARRVPHAPVPTWRMTVLVIDIGGSTTDISVLAVDLEDRSGFPEETAGPQLEGRRYVLRPRVLRATGEQHLGGNLITLKIFYWLKAAVADRSVRAEVRAEDGEVASSGYAERVISHLDSDPVDAELRDLLRKLLPTQTVPDQQPPATPSSDQPEGPPPGWKPGIQSRDFRRLWSWAEKAKQDHFAFRENFPLPIDDLAADEKGVFEVIKKAGSLELGSDDFARLIRPVVEDIAALAVEQVRSCLEDLHERHLDVVALTGRTSKLPQVQEQLTDLLQRRLSSPAGRHGLTGPAVEWDPTSLEPADQNAKQAIVLGAAWAQALSTHSGVEDSNRRRAGLDVIIPKLDGFLGNLSAHFGYVGLGGVPARVLRAGTRFEMCTDKGVYFVRAPWCKAAETLDLHRVLSPGSSASWGVFSYDKLGLDQPSVPDDLWVQAELDTATMPTAHLHWADRKHPRPLLHPLDEKDQGPIDVISLRTFRPLEQLFGSDGKMLLRPEIAVLPVIADQKETPEELERRIEASQVLDVPGQNQPHFDVDFAIDPKISTDNGTFTAQNRARCAGVVSHRPVPVGPDSDHPAETFQLYVKSNGTWVALKAMRAPVLRRDPDPLVSEHPETQLPVWLLLDERGELRLNRGYPAYFQADTVQAARDNPGWVFSQPMMPWPGGPASVRDPYTGEH